MHEKITSKSLISVRLFRIKHTILIKFFIFLFFSLSSSFITPQCFPHPRRPRSSPRPSSSPSSQRPLNFPITTIAFPMKSSKNLLNPLEAVFGKGMSRFSLLISCLRIEFSRHSFRNRTRIFQYPLASFFLDFRTTLFKAPKPSFERNSDRTATR